MAIFINTFPVGLYQCNCTVITDNETGEAIVIDPGAEAQRIIKLIQQQNLKVKFLLHTHAHLDHFGATDEVKQCCDGTKTVLHKSDLFLYDLHREQALMLGLPKTEVSPIDHFLDDEESFVFGTDKLQAIVTPGHTPGSTCFKLENKEHKIIFSGDTLFKGSIGRTDLPGGNSRHLVSSIKDRLYKLDDDFVVVPGHGPTTKVGYEKRHNMFVKG